MHLSRRIINDMPHADYLAVPAMSASGLKHMQRSPAHYFGLHLDPRRVEPEPTAAMANGTLVHACIFEPATVAGRFVVRPPGMTFTTKEGKAWRDAQTLPIIDADALAAAQLQAAAVRALPDVGPLLTDGAGEVSAFWTDEETASACKCRPDWVSPAGDGVVLIDGKTCQDAGPDGFGRAIWNFGYHLQAAWYCDGYAMASGKPVHGFVFAAVESAWPHTAAAYMLTDDVLDAARAINRRLLNQYAECLRSGQWPGYQSTVQLINLPAWANRQLEAV
jgi:hypothetical protein